MNVSDDEDNEINDQLQSEITTAEKEKNIYRLLSSEELNTVSVSGNYVSSHLNDDPNEDDHKQVYFFDSSGIFVSNREADENAPLLEKAASIVKVAIRNALAVAFTQSVEKEINAIKETQHSVFSKKTEENTIKTSTEINVDFHFLSSDQMTSLTADVFQTMLQLKQTLSNEIKASSDSMNVTYNGEEVSNESSLINFDTDLNDSIRFEVTLGDFAKDPVKPHTNIIPVTIQKGEKGSEVVVVEVEKFVTKKPFLGGYRHKLTSVEYHHASSQTNRLIPKTLNRSEEKQTRNTQTAFYSQKSTQTNRQSTTQVTTFGYHSARLTDRVISSKAYVPAVDVMRRKLEAVITLQSYYRRWKAMKLYGFLKCDIEERIKIMKLEEEKLKKSKELRIEKLSDKLLDPKTKQDFEFVYSSLESWKNNSVQEIESNYSKAEQKAALYMLSLQEAKLIANISRKKMDVMQTTNENRRVRFLKKIAAPKMWRSFDGKLISVHTPETVQARHLMELYNELHSNHLSVDERVDLLEAVKNTVKENLCPMVMELIKLIDREIDSLFRGRTKQSLEGLRKRVATLFFLYCKRPSFNPAAQKFQEVPGLNRQEIFYNSRVDQHLPANEFDFRLTTEVTKVDKHANSLNNAGRHRLNYLHYTNMLSHLKRKEENYKDNSKTVYLMKREDIKYIIEVIWGGASALSGCTDPYELTLARWNKEYEWSPWNSILLTKDEANNHLELEDIYEAYGQNFLTKMRAKQAYGRVYFSKVPEVAQILRHELDSQKFAALGEVRENNVFSHNLETPKN